MKTFKTFFLLLLFSGIILSSCSKSDDEEENPGTNPPTANTMTCKYNGTSWTASLAVVATNANNLVTCTGSDSNAHQCQFSLMNVTGTGTYQVGGSMTNPNMGRWTQGLNPEDTYTTSVGLGSGTVEITAFSSTGFSGTFSFTAKNTAQTEVSITEGSFNATF
jgi:hypothetical protein